MFAQFSRKWLDIFQSKCLPMFMIQNIHKWFISSKHVSHSKDHELRKKKSAFGGRKFIKDWRACSMMLKVSFFIFNPPKNGMKKEKNITRSIFTISGIPYIGARKKITHTPIQHTFRYQFKKKHTFIPSSPGGPCSNVQNKIIEYTNENQMKCKQNAKSRRNKRRESFWIEARGKEESKELHTIESVSILRESMCMKNYMYRR